MDLYAKALEKQPAAAWAREMNLTPAALSIAKRQRRLSPALAGNIAIKLGADPIFWTAIAAIEGSKDSELLARLKLDVNRWRKLCPSYLYHSCGLWDDFFLFPPSFPSSRKVYPHQYQQVDQGLEGWNCRVATV